MSTVLFSLNLDKCAKNQKESYVPFDKLTFLLIFELSTSIKSKKVAPNLKATFS